MPFTFKRLALLLSIAAALGAYKAAGAQKKEARFRVEPAASYPAHQTNAGVTVGADPFFTAEKAKTAFGRMNPNQHGVLPVLVVIQNDSGKAIRTENLKLEYLGPTRSRVAATPASEVKYIPGPNRPRAIPGPTGAPKVLKRRNPLDTWEIEGYAFAARMIPPGESASGFFYFESRHLPGSRLYLTGLTEADTGKDLFYFEVSFE
jgi:hypothetical protein